MFVRVPMELCVDWIGVSLKLALLGNLPGNELSELSSLQNPLSFPGRESGMSP